VGFEFVPGPGLTGAHLNCPVCGSVQTPVREFQFWLCAKCRRLLYSHYSIIVRLIAGRWKLSVDRFDYELRVWLIFVMLLTCIVSGLFALSPSLGLHMFAATELVGGGTYIIEAMAIFASGIAPGSFGVHLGFEARWRGVVALVMGILICACCVLTFDLTARFVSAAATEKARKQAILPHSTLRIPPLESGPKSGRRVNLLR
jgi:hypothetical protein